MQRIRKKALLVFLVFPYLLIGMGGAYSFAWCFEENGVSHLEYNFSGMCQIVHQSGCNSEKRAPRSSVSFVNPAMSCLDVPILSVQGLRQNPISSHQNLLPYTQAPAACVLQPPEMTVGESGIITEPSPCAFALKALGTVVLLI